MAGGERRGKRDKKRSNNNRSPKPYGGTKRSNLLERHAEFDENARRFALKRFTANPLPMAIPKDLGEINDFEFTWSNSPVPLKTEGKIAKMVVRRGEFGWLSNQRVDEIAKEVEPFNMTLDQALSLRSALLQQKTVYTHGKMKSRSKAMTKLYREGMTVLQLTKKFDFPPMNIFREILTEMGWSKTKIKETLREPSRFKQRERQEFEAAEAADRVSNVDQSETQERADAFEDIISDWFEEKGVRIRRQPEMVKEQMSEHGRPINTPDLLFLDHVAINGEPIAWIDAKHFYGADVGFQRKKMVKQTNRYVESWGQGAIIFRHGFSDNLHVPGVVLLDNGPLDISRITQS